MKCGVFGGPSCHDSVVVEVAMMPLESVWINDNGSDRERDRVCL